MSVCFTDLHMHLLPGLDDGSASEEDTLRMAVMAAKSGTRTVVATPHSCGRGEYPDPLFHLAVQDALSALCDALEDYEIPLRVLPGMEVFAAEDTVRQLSKGTLLPLGGTRCVLTEFAFDEDPDYTARILSGMTDAGWLPLIAHPERYFFVQEDPDIASRWVRQGCLLQINKGSLLGSFGEDARSCGMTLIRRGLVHAVASDAHSPRRRTPTLDAANSLLCETFSSRTAELLLCINPNRILSGQKPLPVTPQEAFRQ